LKTTVDPDQLEHLNECKSELCGSWSDVMDVPAYLDLQFVHAIKGVSME
jgi:hypothetical protein